MKKIILFLSMFLFCSIAHAAFKKAQVVTPWIGDGQSSETAFRPKLADDYRIKSFKDITGQTAVNGQNFTIEIICEDSVLAAIKEDLSYAVLSSQDI